MQKCKDGEHGSQYAYKNFSMLALVREYVNMLALDLAQSTALTTVGTCRVGLGQCKL